MPDIERKPDNPTIIILLLLLPACDRTDRRINRQTDGYTAYRKVAQSRS